MTDTATQAKAPAKAPVIERSGEPPAQAPRTHSGGWKTKFIEQLRAAPGEWFKIADVSPSVVSHLKKAAPDLEVQSRNSRFVEGRKTRIADVYARAPQAAAAATAPGTKGAKQG